MTATDTDTTRRINVGTYTDTDDKTYRVFVKVTLRTKNAVEPHQTIDHQPIDQYTELSIVGEETALNGRVVGGGQNLATVKRVLDHGTPALTPETITRLINIWDRWHLNGLRAACAHMPKTAHAQWESGAKIVCPDTGYQYGAAWLVEPLPADVEGWVRGLMETPQ